MSKFNKTGLRAATGQGPITAESTPTGTTYQGFRRDTRSELFLLAVSNTVSEDTFYERANDRDDRYGQLVRAVAVEDPEWTLAFITWLRRADEPGELLAYWITRFGRTIPKPVKRGVADAVRQLYDQYALLKYDTDGERFRFAAAPGWRRRS